MGSRVLGRPVTIDIQQQPLADALLAIGTKVGVRIHFQREVVSAVTAPVTIHASKRALGAVLDQLLAGTPLMVVPIKDDLIGIEARVAPLAAGGVVTGTVTDARSQRPLQGVSVAVDESHTGGVTAADGTYRLTNVAAGEHRLTVRLLGYTKRIVTVTVRDGEGTTANVTLEPSVNALDQVVVTGTVIPTELKAVPNAITVITAKDIEQRGITQIQQLFRGDVPGLFAAIRGSASPLDEVFMFSRGATALSGNSAGTSSGTNPIKTYVDGVEMADPKYLSQIDPQSIERIEILTGPQASTIYGSNALNGVMQIFTKRGVSSSPELTLDLMSGLIQNNFSSALTPQHDDRVQINGVEERLSYNAGGSWEYMGPWTPAKQMTRFGGFGGARLTLPTTVGAMTADVTLRRTTTQNTQKIDYGQGRSYLGDIGYYGPDSRSVPINPTRYELSGQTLGLSLTYAPTSWWSHDLALGHDGEDVEQRGMGRVYGYTSDTLLQYSQSHTDRVSIRYTTTARASLTGVAQMTATVGVDGWDNLVTRADGSSLSLTGNITPPTTMARQPGHNRGGFVQTQLSLLDQLSVTYGLRAEWNPTFGEDAQPNYAPRYGIAYTREFGLITAKVRGAYGRSTRPPGVSVKQSVPNTSNSLRSVYGNYDTRLENPVLGPEYQRGGEGGLEVYVGNHASLVVTHYNQTVDGLIANVLGIDSVRSVQPHPLFYGVFTCADVIRIFYQAQNICSSADAAGYTYAWVGRSVNVASVRNQGWELQGSLTTGPLMTHMTYSWTKSRTIGSDPHYKALMPFNRYPWFQYRPGATFQYLPEHTWATTFTYARASTTASLSFNGSGRVWNNGSKFYDEHLSGSVRLQQNVWRFDAGYFNTNPVNTLADFTVSQRFRPWVDGVLEVHNLTNQYPEDELSWIAVMGRQMKAGLRIRLR